MVHPNSLKNLQPIPWTKETAPKGRKNHGLSVNEWRNEMSEWARDEIEAVITNPRATSAQIQAAQEHLQAMAGNLDAIKQACEFTSGKATNTNVNLNQDVHVRRTVIHDRPGGN